MGEKYRNQADALGAAASQAASAPPAGVGEGVKVEDNDPKDALIVKLQAELALARAKHEQIAPPEHAPGTERKYVVNVFNVAHGSRTTDDPLTIGRHKESKLGDVVEFSYEDAKSILAANPKALVPYEDHLAKLEADKAAPSFGPLG